ncbi:MAG: protein kinase domain-containing protein [Steroidobacteraceae bacterium]
MTEIARGLIDSVLKRALELSDGERERFLDETCDRDTDLRRAVDRMLQQCEVDDAVLRPGGGAAGPLWEALARDYSAAFAFEPGERLGAYRVVGMLGRGGMATVYLAERADGQFEQAVALKVLDVARDFDALAARFAQERRILARLEHPNIARLIDGGSTRNGQPYVVMEYVDGEPIDRYCDSRRLDVEQRIRLFNRVADAVQYAHGHLIVHRDLKPSNILVTPDGEPKLLDFGIAKLLDPGSAAPVTRSAQHPMTPEYASPEQVRGEPLTTASDVYQLGYLLYHLLTARSPYSCDRRNVAAMVQAICGEEPVRPSLAVTQPEDRQDAAGLPRDVSGNRSTTTDRLRRRLTGDLDNVVLMALRKDPARRYSSAIHLRDDLARHLDGLPVSARPPTLRYRSVKFVGRHRAGVVSALVVLLAILGALAATAWQARATARAAARAEQQAEIAQSVIDYLNKDMIAAANPAESNRRDVTVAEMLDAAVASAGDRFAGRPRVEATIRLTLGEAYLGLGELGAAESQLAAALSLHGRNGTGNDPEAVRARLQLADVMTFDGRLDEARDLLTEVTRIVTLQGDARSWLHANGRLAGVQRMQGDSAASLKRLEELLPLAIANLGPGDETTQEFQEMLGGALSASGRADEAIVLYRSALEAAVDRFGENHVAALRPRANLGGAMRRAGRLPEAIEPLESALRGYRAVLGEEHVQTLWAAQMLGMLYADLRRFEEAGALFRDTAERRARLLGPEHPHTLSSRRELARAEAALGNGAR